MTTSLQNLPPGAYATDLWFDSGVANGSFPENRDKASFSFGDKGLENCVGFQVLGVTAPCSYYVIDTTNNLITFTVTDSGSKVYQVAITPGSYTASNIVTQMTTDMTNNTTVVSGGGSADDLITAYHFAVLVDATTSQLLIYQTVAAASGKSFSISFPSGGCQEILGFQGATTTDTFASTSGNIYDNSGTLINSATTKYLYSPYFVQLSGPLYLVLHSSLAGESDQPPCLLPNQARGDQLDVIVVNANYDGTITSAPSDRVCVRNNTTSIQNAEFYFTLGTRTTFSTYSLSGAVTTTNYLSFNGGSFLVGIRFFLSSRSNNNLQSNNESGDKYMQAAPIREGTGMVPNQAQVQGSVVVRPPSRRAILEQSVSKRRRR